MINFYRLCLPNAAELQAPLNDYLKDSKKNDKRLIPWSDDAVVAFDKIKSNLVEATLLVHPREGSRDARVDRTRQISHLVRSWSNGRCQVLGNH